jgi:uncharacterized membrane protein YkvA (DUF1232 family)
MARRGWSIGSLGEAAALIAALFDRRTPWFAKLLAGLVLLYLIWPIDFIPDFIPVVGLLDDAAIVALGLWLAARFIPPDVMDHARRRFSRKNLGAK